MGKQKINSNVLTISVVGLSAALIAVCSWISIPLGAVPITLQTFAVFTIAALFDLKIGLMSITSYLLLGAVGVPVFANFKSGISVLKGPTGGYLIGFLLSAVIIGLFKKIEVKPKLFLVVGMIFGLIVCYAFGTAWFYFVYSGDGEKMGVLRILSLCVVPFIIPDMIKITAAFVLVRRLKVPLEKIGFKYSGTGFAV